MARHGFVKRDAARSVVGRRERGGREGMRVALLLIERVKDWCLEARYGIRDTTGQIVYGMWGGCVMFDRRLE